MRPEPGKDFFISFNKALAPILRYSLVERRGQSLFIHRLVQAVVRDRLSGADRRVWVEAAVRLLDAAFPFKQIDVRTRILRGYLRQQHPSILNVQRNLEALGEPVE
jgi:hypothetical protein